MILIPQPPFFAGLSGYIAEMGSAFLCAALGIAPTVRHADYLGSWLEVLREDNRAIFKAASQASKAADWLLSRHAAYRTALAGGEHVGALGAGDFADDACEAGAFGASAFGASDGRAAA